MRLVHLPVEHSLLREILVKIDPSVETGSGAIGGGK